MSQDLEDRLDAIRVKALGTVTVYMGKDVCGLVLKAPMRILVDQTINSKAVEMDVPYDDWGISIIEYALNQEEIV